jgi:3-oxoadipate enol-lactonase
MPATQITMLQRASLVNKQGVSAIVETVIDSGVSEHTKSTSPLSVALVRALVLGTTPGGYASSAHALAGASDPDYSQIKAKTLIVAGEEDYLSNERTSEFLRSSIEGSEVKTIAECGHWHAVENPLKLREFLEEFFAWEQ